MPQLIPAIVYYIALEAGATYLVATLAALVATYAVSAHKAEEARKKARRAYNASLTDRGVMIRSGVAPRQMVVGRAKVSGPIVYILSTGAKKEYLHLVIALAAHEIDAVEKIYFNDVELPALDGSGFVTSGEFSKTNTSTEAWSGTSATGVLNVGETISSVQSVSWLDGDNMIYIPSSGYTVSGSTVTVTSPPPGTNTYYVNYTTSAAVALVRIKIHRGQAGQTADSDLVSESGGQWTSAHRGDSIAYLYVRLQYDQDVFGSVGVPNISAVVRGAKVFDPRTSTTAWSENSALITAWWLRQQEIGLKQAAAAINNTELSAAANICDELVAINVGGTTQKRYTTNGTLSAEDSLRSNLETLVVPMAGSATYCQGQWRIRAGAHEAPDLFLDESDFAPGGIQVVPFANRRDLFNAVTGTYIDAASGYIERQFPLVDNPTYQAWDGGEQITRNVVMPMVDEAMRAQRLAKIAIERARQAETIQATFKVRSYDCKPNDVVALSIASMGWTNKLFVVRERVYKRGEADRVQLTLQATASGVWDWNYGDATQVDLAPNTDLPAIERPTALTGLTATTGVVKQPDGTEIVRALLQWTISNNVWVVQGGRIEIQHKRGDALVWTDDPPVPGSAVSGYAQPIDRDLGTLVRVRPVNVLGTAGPWSTKVIAAVNGDTTPPANVTGFTAAAARADVTLSWTKCPDGDYADTELRRGSWATPDETLIITGNSTVWKAPEAGSYDWYAKHMDRSGNYSTGTAHVAIATTSGAAAPVEMLTAFVQGGTVSPDDCFAAIRLNTDGSMSRRSGSGAFYTSGNWFFPASSGIGTNYWVRFSQVSGGAPNSGSSALDTWHALTSARYIEIAETGVGANAGLFDVYVASDSAGQTIVGYGRWQLIAIVLP
jgi:hypothetical protein